MKTATVIKRMMLEPCGRNLVDSGGAFGYAYEKRKNLEKAPVTTVEWEIESDDTLCGLVTKSMYHHLCETLEYDPYLTRRLNEFFKKRTKELPYVNTDMWENFVDTLRDSDDVFSGNTYNNDSTLDGCFCYTSFKLPDSLYVILSTHNGCDARWGYSTPKVFRQVDDYALLDTCNIWCYCESGCMECSELNSDYGTCIYIDADEWSDNKEPDKYLLKDGKLYCKDCGKEVFVTC